MDFDKQTLARIRLGIREAARRWIYDPNVTFIDFGWPTTDEILRPDKLAIRIHVKQKYPTGPALEAAVDQGITRGPIPKKIADFQVDIPEGNFRLNQFPGWWVAPGKRARRMDPMKGGISISDAYRNTYATLGCLVKDRETGKEMLLSNWHVLVGSAYAPPGLPIIQPGRLDGGRDADIVARLSRHALAFGYDAAVAELTGSRALINEQFERWPLKGMAQPDPGMQVVKSGRKTGVTNGVVSTLVPGPFKMEYSGVQRLLNHVLRIEPRIPGSEVSAGGDSGSLWCEESTRCAVGLHFAGMNEPETALAMSIQPVLDALNVDLVF